MTERWCYVSQCESLCPGPLGQSKPFPQQKRNMFNPIKQPSSGNNVKWPPCTGFVLFFRNKFPWLFQNSDWFFHNLNSQDLNVNSPYCLPYISYFLLELNRFQNFPGPVAFFQDSPRCISMISGIMFTVGSVGRHYRSIYPPTIGRVSTECRLLLGRHIDHD